MFQERDEFAIVSDKGSFYIVAVVEEGRDVNSDVLVKSRDQMDKNDAS